MEKILNKFGYYKHIQKFTEEEICSMFAETIGDVSEYVIKAKDEIVLFNKLSEIEGLNDWLRATAAKDIQRYFAAEDEMVRRVVKGAVARIAYIRSKLSRLRDKTEVPTTKVPGLRYK